MRWKSCTESTTACIVVTLLTACGGSAPSAASPYRSSPAYTSGGAEATSVASTEGFAPAMQTMSTAPMPVTRESMARAGAHVPPPPVATTTTSGATTHAPETQTRDQSAEAAPMLIYTASVAMTVERPTESIDQVVEIASGAGGFLAQRNDAMVQIRVPSARFRELLARLERLGEVTHREVQAEDVSEQFHDLDVQLTNLRSVRTRLQEFLARAANVQEALIVEHELERVGAQIDQIEGRMRFLSARAAFSTISIYVTRRVTAVIDNTPVPTNDVAMPFAWLDELGIPRLLQLR